MNTESEEIAESKSFSASFNIQDALWAIGFLAVTLCLSPAVAFYMLLVA